MDLRLVSQGPALRTLFFAHLVPVIWATQTQWLPISYSTYNILFLLTVLWSLHARDSEDALFMGSALNLISIPLDAITIGVYYEDPAATAFSTFMVITNLLLRPITSLVLLRFYNERAGRFSAFGIPGLGSGSGSGRQSYEDIDHRQSVPHSIVDTGSPSRQPEIVPPVSQPFSQPSPVYGEK